MIRRVTEREEGSHCDWPLTSGYQTAGHEIDGRDMVSVKGMS